jgi:hypothetical protein
MLVETASDLSDFAQNINASQPKQWAFSLERRLLPVAKTVRNASAIYADVDNARASV